MIRSIRLLLFLSGLIASGTALAHTGEHAGGGWAAGFAHPFMGLDHLFAIVAVGLWAAQLGGRCRIGLPALFVAVMVLGALAGLNGLPIPHVEGFIALTVLVLGLGIALAARAQWPVAAVLVGLFALAHGHAHGAEAPAWAALWQYFSGFGAATALLHALGVVAGTAALRSRPALLRAGGAAIGLAGSWLLVTAIA